MDASEAGREATRAGARRLLLTHVPCENDYEVVLRKAAAEYAGPTEIARPGLRYEL